MKKILSILLIILITFISYSCGTSKKSQYERRSLMIPKVNEIPINKRYKESKQHKKVVKILKKNNRYDRHY